MYHYLRTKDGKKVVDVEPWIRDGHYDFSGGVCHMKNFLELYDCIPDCQKNEFKQDFDDIDEMRGWFFEVYLPTELKWEVSDENLHKAHAAIKSRLMSVADKYGLVYGSD